MAVAHFAHERALGAGLRRSLYSRHSVVAGRETVDDPLAPTSSTREFFHIVVTPVALSHAHLKREIDDDTLCYCTACLPRDLESTLKIKYIDPMSL